MLQGLFYISLFFITILGILILRPTPAVEPLARNPTPEEIGTRNQITRSMARFLEAHPSILAQQPHLNPLAGAPALPTPISIPNPPEGHSRPLDFSFQGATVHFQNPDDFNAWVYERASRGAMQFLNQLDATLDPEIKLDILTRTGEIDIPPEARELSKELLLKEARALLQIRDPGHEQLAEKYLNLYLERETDAALAKKRTEEVLGISNTSHP